MKTVYPPNRNSTLTRDLDTVHAYMLPCCISIKYPTAQRSYWQTSRAYNNRDLIGMLADPESGR